MSADSSKSRPRRANTGWVAIKVSTRRADRAVRQLEVTSEFRVDEHGAMVSASPASCTFLHGETPDSQRDVVRDESAEATHQPHWRALIHYDQYDHSFWFTPLSTCPAFHTPCSVLVPSRRRDIFVQLGERGSNSMSWPLQAGDGFRLGHTYVVVLRVLHHTVDLTGSGARAAAAEAEIEGEGAGADADVRAQHGEVRQTAEAAASPGSAGDDDSDDGPRSARKARQQPAAGNSSAGGAASSGLELGDDDDDSDGVVYGNAKTADGDVAECCFCYEPGTRTDPLMRACRECRGSVQYVHLSCLRRWSSPQGSGRVPAQCPTCKRDLRADVQEKLVMPPALLLEIYWSHHRQRRCQWVTFAARNTATIGKMEDNDVVIPDHTVSRRHARIEYTGGKFVLHDTQSSRGSFAPIRSPLKLAWGQEVCMTVGKSVLTLTPKLSWFFFLTRWLPPMGSHAIAGRRTNQQQQQQLQQGQQHAQQQGQAPAPAQITLEQPADASAANTGGEAEVPAIRPQLSLSSQPEDSVGSAATIAAAGLGGT